MEYSPSLTLRSIMNRQPVVIPPDTPIQDAVRLMNQRRIGAVLVQGRDGELGIFTERDVLRQAVEAAHGWWERPIGDWMTKDVITLSPDASWEQARAVMKTRHVRHLPVVQDGRVVGIVTTRDLIGHANEYLNRIVADRTLELRQAMERLQHRDEEMRLHMSVAGKIQTRLLPSDLPEFPELCCATHYQPVDPLGGDYYDFAYPTPEHVGIMIADATGHSIPAAFVAIMAVTVFANVSRQVSPANAMRIMNRQLHGLTGEHFVTAFYGIFHLPSRRMTYVNAGQPYPYVVRASGDVEPLKAKGLMLGILEDSTYEEQIVELRAGDKFLLYTDGVPDCRDEDERVFGTDRLEDFLAGTAAESAKSLVTRLSDLLTAHRGQRDQVDDITMVAGQVR